MMIKNSDGLVLVVERKKRLSAWQLPQGGINLGETEQQAVIREMQEELGFNEKDMKDLLQHLGTHTG